MLTRQRLLERFNQVLYDMEPVGDLGGVRCAAGRSVGEAAPTVSTNDRNARVGGEPVREGLGLAVREEIKGTLAFQVHHNGAIAPPAQEAPIIDPYATRQGVFRIRRRPNPSQQRRRTTRQPQGLVTSAPLLLRPEQSLPHTARCRDVGCAAHRVRPGRGGAP